MSWDIVLFKSKQVILAIKEVDETMLQPTNFTKILEEAFDNVTQDDHHRCIVGKDFSIEFYTSEEPVSNTMLSIYGEQGFFELIELAKQNGWQIFDTAFGDMINLKNPASNGYKNHKAYVERIMKK